VKAAEAAIFLRQQALVNNPDGHVERQAIDDAMHALGVTQTEKLNYPDWNKKYCEVLFPRSPDWKGAHTWLLKRFWMKFTNFIRW
jgi:hypothetical protein